MDFFDFYIGIGEVCMAITLSALLLLIVCMWFMIGINWVHIRFKEGPVKNSVYLLMILLMVHIIMVAIAIIYIRIRTINNLELEGINIVNTFVFAPVFAIGAVYYLITSSNPDKKIIGLQKEVNRLSKKLKDMEKEAKQDKKKIKNLELEKAEHSMEIFNLENKLEDAKHGKTYSAIKK